MPERQDARTPATRPRRPQRRRETRSVGIRSSRAPAGTTHPAGAAPDPIPGRREAVSPALSYNAALVMQAVVNGHGYGFEIMQATGLPSGTVYPILRRLESSGHMASEWEDAATAHEEGRPPRRYYRVTPEGRPVLSAARERLRRQRALFLGPERPSPEHGGSS